ncbi:MAG TPA: type II secretion system F family protein, partial [Oryzihumus sp.]|nr:type II secretion system F family protein [Oryzihumus sp.]
SAGRLPQRIRDLLHLRARRDRVVAHTVLALVDAVAPALEAGLPPAAAFVLAADSVAPVEEPRPGAASAWVRTAGRAVADGAPVSGVLRRGGGTLVSRELGVLAAAWSLSEETGGPLADAVRTAGSVVRGSMAQRERMLAAVAGARSTMNILTVLPLGGPLIALAVGLDPSRLYLGSALNQVCLVIGVVLALAGRAWVRRLVAGAVRGPVLS